MFPDRAGKTVQGICLPVVNIQHMRTSEIMFDDYPLLDFIRHTDKLDEVARNVIVLICI